MRKSNYVLLVTLAATLLPKMAIASTEGQTTAVCPNFLNHSFRKLHSDKTVNLCDHYSGKPVLLVNTASHCGFTGQFKGLESLYKAYKEQGFEIIGFSSNDFKQAARTEAKAADICYVNYGVSFTMLAPTTVVGEKANVVFKHIAETIGQAPSWNFNKYLITESGAKIEYFDSRAQPRQSRLELKIKEALADSS